MDTMDFISLGMIATGIVSILILLFINDFDVDSVMFDYTDEGVIK